MKIYHIVPKCVRQFLLWVWNRPSFIARRLFNYDRKVFLKFSGAFNSGNKNSELAKIIMSYHVIEKGLTMPRRHMDFGHKGILNLLNVIKNYESKSYGSNDQILHAIGVVREYRQLHCDYQDEGNERFWSIIDEFLTQHPDVGSTSQIHTTSEKFYGDKDAPFPRFAKSRATVRHYAIGSVPLSDIRQAVELAMTAPSACNRQYIRVHIVTSHACRDRIMSLQNGNRGFGGDADKILIVTGDLYGVRWPEERHDVYTNGGIFAMNLAYALFYYGIAHCILNWSVGPRTDKIMHRELDIPENETIILLFACGKPAREFDIANSPRKRVEDIVVIHE